VTVTHVLVDLDGTLSDSEPGITSCLRAALVDEGLPVPPADVLRQAIGPPFELGLPLIGVPGDRLWAVIAGYRERYERDGLYETAVYDGVVPMLDRLAAAGLVLAIATAKPEPTAVRVVEHLGLGDRFAALVGATFEPGRRTKGEVIAHALERLGIPPGPHAVMVGDHSHDVEGARQHGLGSVGVLWGYGTEEELRRAGATALAADPAAVVDLLVPAGAPATRTL
jgi:phosphoglycolate phosphatase